MEKYSISLPNEKAKTYEIVTIIILIINTLVSAFTYFSANEPYLINIHLWGSIIGLVSLCLILLNRFKKLTYVVPPEIPFFILSVTWFLSGWYLLALCIIAVGIIGIYARKKFIVVFTEDGINYPSFPRKLFLWKDVSNVVLKDGYLTIDLKNNILIQALVSKDSFDAVNESAFNTFCRKFY